MKIGKREFLASSLGLGAGLAVSAALGQASQPAAGRRGAGTPSGRPRYAFSGKQPSSADLNYKPRRFNKAIELWEDGQPVYHTPYTPSGASDGYEMGLKMSQTWADIVSIESENGCFDLPNLRNFMRGLADGGPTRSGHRMPATFVALPTTGFSEAYMQANAWVIGQVLATGVTGVDICHARDPKAIEVAVQASRYPFDFPGVPRQPFKDLLYGGEGLRGSGSQGYPSQIWGMSASQYLHIADVWPLNPKGEMILGTKIEDHFSLANCEKTLAVPGVTFTEWGPGDMNMSLNGLDAFPLSAGGGSGGDGEGGGRVTAPNVAAARLHILDVCKKNKIKLIDTPRPEAIIDSIKMGMLMFAVSEDAAIIGREYTKRKMPV